MLSQEIMAELDSKITYTENTIVLLCDVVTGVKEMLKELDKAIPYAFYEQTTDYKTMVNFCKEHNVICLETYYKRRQRKAGRKVCVRI